MNYTRKTYTLFLTGIFSILFVYSCGTSSTTITGTWQDDNEGRKYDHILVAALTTQVGAKSIVEKQLQENLSETGIKASQSIKFIPPKFIEDDNQKQKILEVIQTDGIDAILTVSLIDRDTETRYVPGSTSYMPYPTFRYYGNFWGYYNHWYPQLHSPGYYSEDKVYFIETNLYDAETENLVWSAQSETYNPVSLESFSSEFAEEIVDRLISDGILYQ